MTLWKQNYKLKICFVVGSPRSGWGNTIKLCVRKPAPNMLFLFFSHSRRYHHRPSRCCRVVRGTVTPRNKQNSTVTYILTSIISVMKSGPSIMHIVFKALGFFGLPARERKGNMTSLLGRVTKTSYWIIQWGLRLARFDPSPGSLFRDWRTSNFTRDVTPSINSQASTKKKTNCIRTVMSQLGLFLINANIHSASDDSGHIRHVEFFRFDEGAFKRNKTFLYTYHSNWER